MKIIQVHNYYRHKGGEANVLDKEKKLLESNGHSVIRFIKKSSSIKSTLDKLRTFYSLHYSKSIYREFSAYLKKQNPDLVHVHNTFPLITPSVFDACQYAGIPVVYTLHNFRLIYPNALMLHEGDIDQRTLKASAYGVVKDKVYKDSYLQTFTLARLIEYHRKGNTWDDKVDRFIVLTDFAKNIFSQGGLPDDKMRIKPNFLPAPKIKKEEKKVAPFFLFVGRISYEKGLDLIVEAAKKLPDIKFKIAGEGELLEKYQHNSSDNIEWLGRVEWEQVNKLMETAFALLFPSRWFEGFPMTLVEAYSHGLPVISSNIGSQGEIVIDGKTGLHFNNNSSDSLKEKIEYLYQNKTLRDDFAKQAFLRFSEKYTDKVNYKLMMDIYAQALEESQQA